MTAITRLTDLRARVSLPKQFASTTVIIEQVSNSELRIRMAKVDDEPVKFIEEEPRQLSYRDQIRFLELLDNPPPPNAALKKAAKEYQRDRSRSRTRS